MNSRNLWKICLSRKDDIGLLPLIVFQFNITCLSVQTVLERTGLSSSVFSFSRSEWASYCFSIRMSKLLWVRNPLANHPHQPRPIQIQGMPIGYCRRQNDCQKVEKSTGQSASPSLERLPSSSPTTQPSQWWGTSIKYLKNEKQTKKTNRTGPFLTSDFPLPLYTLGGRSRS